MIASSLRLIIYPLYLLALSLAIVQASEKATGPEEAANKRRLIQIAQDIRMALLKKDAESLLKYDLRGESVKGIVYDSYTADKKQLKDRKSQLYCHLFDTMCLRALAFKAGATRSPFFRKSVYEFFSTNEQVTIEVLFWSPGKDDRIASVAFLKPSFRINLSEVQRKGWPLDQWAEGFIAVDFILVQDRWRYYVGIFKIAVDEEDIG